MFELKLYDLGFVDEKEYTRVLCVAKYKDKWVFSFNKKRGGWEIPGGHIEQGESWLECAKREMFEETGATQINVTPICVYSISTYALLCYAEIQNLDKLPQSEISEIGFFDELPKNLSFPENHKLLFEKVKNIIEK